MSYPTQGIVSNALPGTGVFGFGQVQVFPVSGTFTVPAGVNNVRVRLWGAGAGSSGGGGGFAMRTIFNLAGLGVTSVAVSVPQGTTGAGGTASFGTFVSATGGNTGTYPAAGGTGVGGDVNTSGGLSNTSGSGGGGVGSLWGNGGNGGVNGTTTSGASGGGSNQGYSGGSGLSGSGAFNGGTTASYAPQTMIGSIDWIGTGGGGSANQSGVNGGGGGQSIGCGGFPGGGGGSSNAFGASGLVIVEY